MLYFSHLFATESLVLSTVVMAKGPFDTCILPSALIPGNCDLFLRALEKAKPGLFSSGNTQVRLETTDANGGPDSGSRITDVVTDDEEVGRALQVGTHWLRVLLACLCLTFADRSTSTASETPSCLLPTYEHQHQCSIFPIADVRSRCSFLFQNHSWAPFNLSGEALKQIVTAVRPHPEFLRLFKGFGEPHGGYPTDFSGGYSSHIESARDTSSSPSSPGSEKELPYGIKAENLQRGFLYANALADFMYTLRYMAANGRSQCPWSDRRIGVYHKRDSSKSIWVILQPTAAALELPQAVSDDPQRQHDPALLHVLLFRATLPAWAAYLTYLETLVRADVGQPPE